MWRTQNCLQNILTECFSTFPNRRFWANSDAHITSLSGMVLPKNGAICDLCSVRKIMLETLIERFVPASKNFVWGA